jgi:threonine dehydratase
MTMGTYDRGARDRVGGIYLRRAGELIAMSERPYEAMRFLFERMKLVVEPSGVAGVAALLTGKLDFPGTRVGVVLSGGNVSAQRFAELVKNSDEHLVEHVGWSHA